MLFISRIVPVIYNFCESERAQQANNLCFPDYFQLPALKIHFVSL